MKHYYCKRKKYQAVYRCYQCGGLIFLPQEASMRQSLLQFLQERITAYDQLLKEFPSQSRLLGEKIDELLTLTTLLFGVDENGTSQKGKKG
jgi:hypothetical protein